MKEYKSGSNAYQTASPSTAETLRQESLHDDSQKLKREIEELHARLNDRKAALPMHDATPQQWIDIEELEDAIAQKKKELKNCGE